MSPRAARPKLAVRHEFLLCQRSVLGHAWDELPGLPHDVEPPAYGDPYVCRCTRCGTLRIYAIDSMGKINQRRMIYPEGYSYAAWAPGGTRPDATLLRLEAVARQRYAIDEAAKRSGAKVTPLRRRAAR